MENIIKTAEAVSIAHPDKVCDQISDAILDECLRQDPYSRVAVETMGGHKKIFIVGEITSKAKLNFEEIAKKVYLNCGYKDRVKVIVNIARQSTQIKSGVDKGGAGDQGIMIGYACDETSEMMPLELVIARKIAKAIGKRDGKVQVTLKNGAIIKLVTSVCGKYPKKLLNLLKNYGIRQNDKRWLKNPGGKWTIGGFSADTGLTGRKIVIDAYGPDIPVGGGSFSGKDPTKVDRSGAYMARKIAVDLLKKYKAKEVLVKLAYSIAVAKPLMANAKIKICSTGRCQVSEKNNKVININEIKGYDLTPNGIMEFLKLRRPIYEKTAKYGHFGNNFLWDQ